MELFSIRRGCLRRNVNEHNENADTRYYQMLVYRVYILGFRLPVWWTYFEEQIPNSLMFTYFATGYSNFKSLRPDLVDQVTLEPYIFKF